MTIIFDFDGTIADSFDTIVTIFQTLTGNHQMTSAEIAELRTYPAREVLKRLGVAFWKAPFMLSRGRLMMTSQVRHLKTFEGIPKIIEQLNAEGHELFIISSNSTRNVKLFLKEHHMYKYFVEVKGGVGLFSKARALNKLMRRNNLELKNAIYIGDETRDIESAHEIGMQVIAVAWGFSDRNILETHQPTAIADHPEDVVRILEEL